MSGHPSLEGMPAKSLVAVQDQADSLTAVVLQNRRELDLLTSEKGGPCLFLGEECCFYTNRSGIVRNMAQWLWERIAKRKQELADSWSSWTNLWGWASYLLPLAGPLLRILLALLFGPCMLHLLTHFLSSHLEAIKLQMMLQT